MGSQYNAVTHGLYAKEALLPFENRRQYLRFCRELVKSLAPENEVQHHLARDIAEDAWKIARIDRTIRALQDEIYGQLDPIGIAKIAEVPEAFHAAAPSWLIDMRHKVKRETKLYHAQVCAQYIDCYENFATIPNLVAVYKQYPQLFALACEFAQAEGKRPILNTATNSLDTVWQQNIKQLWQVLERTYHHAYYLANWDAIRKTAQPWVEAWYFIEAGKNSRLQHHQALALKARADFRKQLQAYERLKKNTLLFSTALLRLTQDFASTEGAVLSNCQDANVVIAPLVLHSYLGFAPNLTNATPLTLQH